MQLFKLRAFLFCLALPVFALGGTLTGKVKDEKGNPLPYATIYIEHTTIGVNANGNGDYNLTISPGLYKVVCQFVGYQQSTFNLSVTGDETIRHDFVLKSQSLEMKEVVVHASDPAYEIIRNAIKKREYHRGQVRSFQASIYLKGVIRSRRLPKKFMGQKVVDETDIVDSVGKGVLYLTEEYADYYSDGDHQKTVIHSVHESGNPGGNGFSTFPSVITFYDNDVNIFGRENRGFISPISDHALLYYKYKLLGQFQEQGHTVYKIQVIPRRAYEPCFSGDIYIADEDFAIHSLHMALAKKSGMDVFDTLKIDQLFLPINKDNWVIKSQVLYFTVNMFGFDVTAAAVTDYNNQKVNEPIPDSVFAQRIVSAYDRDARKKDSAYWQQNRPIPLEKDEQKDFVSKDSLRKKISDPEFVDSMRRRNNRFKPIGMLTGGYYHTGRQRKNTWSVNGILPLLSEGNMLNFNTVEGFNIAPDITWTHRFDTGKLLHTEAIGRYGFSNTHFNSAGRIYYTQNDRELLNKSWTVGVEGGKYVYQYNPENPVVNWFNTWSALLYRENDLKIYERWDAAAYLGRNYGNGLSWYLKTAYQQRLPLENTTTYSFFKGDNADFKSNNPPELVAKATEWVKNDAALLWASVSWKPGYTYTQFPDHRVANGSAWPRFTLWYHKGVPGIINSVSNFDEWRFSVVDERHLGLVGNLNYRVSAGGFLNSNYVSVPDLMHLYGNRGIGFASPYLMSFQFAQYYQFSNTESIYGEAHLEYHLKGLLSNKIPLLRQARWFLLFGTNTFYARQADYYTEAFVGVDNIGFKAARLLRVDFVQSWDSYKGRNSGLRIGLGLPGEASMRTYPMQGEW